MLAAPRAPARAPPVKKSGLLVERADGTRTAPAEHPVTFARPPGSSPPGSGSTGYSRRRKIGRDIAMLLPADANEGQDAATTNVAVEAAHAPPWLVPRAWARAACAVAVAAWPAVASAHVGGGAFILLLPTHLYLAGGAIVVAASFALVALVAAPVFSRLEALSLRLERRARSVARRGLDRREPALAGGGRPADHGGPSSAAATRSRTRSRCSSGPSGGSASPISTRCSATSGRT